MRPEDLRERDQRQLRELFYRVFDRSRMEALLKVPDEKLDREAAFLGEGQHFRAWRLRGGHAGETPLVLKRASPGLGPLGGVERRQWVQAVTRLKGVGGLVPPFEVLQIEGHIGIVMPYGDKALVEAAPHWQPMQSRLAELDQDLAARGLTLGDIPQGRSLSGIPFVYDLSDVQETP